MAHKISADRGTTETPPVYQTPYRCQSDSLSIPRSIEQRVKPARPDPGLPVASFAVRPSLECSHSHRVGCKAVLQSRAKSPVTWKDLSFTQDGADLAPCLREIRGSAADGPSLARKWSSCRWLREPRITKLELCKSCASSVLSPKFAEESPGSRSRPSDAWGSSRTGQPCSGATARVPSADAGCGRVAPWNVG
jgi:hypothetical protein